MQIEALVLRSDKTDCTNISPNIKNLKQSVLGDKAQANINNKATLAKGIHLHWTLPKALRHSFMDENDMVQFPLVPNRWAVTRIITNKGIEQMPARIWMVESDAQSNEKIPNWTLFEKNKLSLKSVGKTTEWSASYTEAPSEVDLTAVAAANPLFASFYPECKNVFGFHDDLKDITDDDVTFTYIVTGWYSDASKDPIAPLDFTGQGATKEQQARKKEFEEFKEQWPCDSETYPTSSMLHATVHSVSWKSGIQDGVPSGEIQIFAGNTPAESLSAQIVKNAPESKPGVEELLTALQYELLEDDRNQPSLTAIKSDIHKRGFNPKDAGPIWEIIRAESSDQQMEDSDKKPQFPEDSELLEKLNQLNQIQESFNSLSLEMASLQREYYFLWYKQAQKTVGAYNVPSFNYDAARKDILKSLDDSKASLKTKQKEIDALVKEITQHTLLSGPDPEFKLNQKLEGRFWEPNDPVLLLSGPGVGNTDKPIFRSADKKIQCRTPEQLVDTLNLNVPNAGNDIPVKISTDQFSVMKVDELSNTNMPFQEWKQLIGETLLLDEALAIDIALLAYKEAQLGAGKDKTSSVVKDFAKKVVIKVQSSPIPKDSKKLAPDVGSLSKWEQAWTPLFMAWEATYTANNNTIKGLDLTQDADQWKLEEQLFFRSQKETTRSEDITFQGISPFSKSAFTNLSKQIPDEIVNKYGKLNMIAQSLSGLNKYLLMQRPDIQLPPFKYSADPIYNFDSEYEVDEDELKTIGPDGYVLGCDPGDTNGAPASVFNPLREGVVKIKSLSIVDSFGQTRKVIIDQEEGENNNPEINCSQSIKAASGTSNHVISLPPRIVQPSRLKFQWLNAKDEVVYQDAGTLNNPVLGWLVPNYLDNNVLVYDGDGKEVIMLQVVPDLTKELGIDLIKTPFPGVNSVPDLSEKEHLKKLIDHIDKGSIAAGLMDLAYKVNLNVAGANAMKNNTAALLHGQPIAIARCALSLEVMGLPAYDQRWDQSGKENTGGIETVKFPLVVGDFNTEKDGVIGYFPDSEKEHLYTPANAPDFKFSKSETFFKNDGALKLSVGEEPIKMTLLMDPSAGAHLATAILPTKRVEMFPYNAEKLLQSLNVGFMVAPFIADKVEPGVPVPTSIDGNWKWTHKTNVNTWQADQPIPEGKNKQLSRFSKQQVYEGWIKLSNLKRTTNH